MDAAVQLGTEQSESVIISWPLNPTPTQRLYPIKHISGSRGTLTATRSSAAADANILIHLSCTMGRFSQPALEQTILTYTSDRLTALCGREFAPIPE